MILRDIFKAVAKGPFKLFFAKVEQQTKSSLMTQIDQAITGKRFQDCRRVVELAVNMHGDDPEFRTYLKGQQTRILDEFSPSRANVIFNIMRPLYAEDVLLAELSDAFRQEDINACRSAMLILGHLYSDKNDSVECLWVAQKQFFYIFGVEKGMIFLRQMQQSTPNPEHYDVLDKLLPQKLMLKYESPASIEMKRLLSSIMARTEINPAILQRTDVPDPHKRVPASGKGRISPADFLYALRR